MLKRMYSELKLEPTIEGKFLGKMKHLHPELTLCVEYVAFQFRLQAHMVMSSPMVENTYS